MNVQTPIRLTAAEESLAAQLESVGAGDAAVRFREAGLPTRRVEAYHYTDLKVLLSEVPPLAEAVAGTGAPVFDIPGAYRIVVANGVMQNAGTAPAGVITGKVGGSTLTMRDDTVVRLNSALVKEAVNIELAGSVDPVIHIDRRTDGDAAHVATGSKITVAPGARATVIETVATSDAGHMGNLGTYVALGEGAEVTHIVVDLSATQATQFSTLEYRIDANAKLMSIVIQAGANLARAQIFANFVGEGAHGDFFGLNLIDTDQHRDITLDVTHGVPNTTSTELFKQIGRGHGKGVFQGKITVAKDAQKTDAKMMSQGLMLSEGAEILTKPELVIFADDVVCGHGATCGDLDETWMFYLMSRGIPKAEAETILIRAFLEEIVDAVEDEALGEALSGIVDGWLAQGA
ncbi:Fe-S cluster assembly protein SufD [Pelagibacterium xiamenense]|uniref:Fe-S cluster assembly protein SufD n=1 Tax=Pelagibacterium xiamenense TaxID=2901140 RepID=UPI001E556ABC|nr:Fe-S cluster assembly protein SufD [Pelagibacterium xiamenense]MCD7061097.1 Fe-S cluster assembly protein SufD [Pelagibacterium xiamenense]